MLSLAEESMKEDNTLGFYKGGALTSDEEPLKLGVADERSCLILVPHGSGTLMYQKRSFIFFQNIHQFYSGSFDPGSFHGDGNWTLNKTDFFGTFEHGTYAPGTPDLRTLPVADDMFSATYKGTFAIQDDYDFNNSDHALWAEYNHMILPNGHGSLEILAGGNPFESYEGHFEMGHYHGKGILTRGTETFEGRFEHGAFKG